MSDSLWKKKCQYYRRTWSQKTLITNRFIYFIYRKIFQNVEVFINLNESIIIICKILLQGHATVYKKKQFSIRFYITPSSFRFTCCIKTLLVAAVIYMVLSILIVTLNHPHNRANNSFKDYRVLKNTIFPFFYKFFYLCSTRIVVEMRYSWSNEAQHPIS